MRRLLRRGWLRYIFVSGILIALLIFYMTTKTVPQPNVIRDPTEFVLKPFRLHKKWWANMELPPGTFTGPYHGGRGETGNGANPLNVFVIEEHHEAVPYWFGAANNGLIPKTGNTLIHIDGHSDLAPPDYVSGYPLFQWPKSSQLRYLIQRNDAFIQASSMAGLVTRMIWVWPKWDRPNHQADYTMYTASLGWTASDPIPGKSETILKTKNFCHCLKNETGTLCMYMDATNEAHDGEQLPPEKCHIRKVLVVEEIEENKAVRFFQKNDWISRNENVILDIDEDFYGCTYGVTPLLKANVSAEVIDSIDAALHNLFCPRTTEHETLSDKILGQVISVLMSLKVCKLKGGNCSLLKTEALDIFENIKNKIMLCPRTTVGIQKSASRLVEKLLILNVTQMKVLKRTGFCSVTTPKSHPLLSDTAFGICYGANTPLESVVLEHAPSKTEVMTRSILLKGMLKYIRKYSPRFVTLCRSMRDGYTPREHFDQIEKDILTSLNHTFEHNIQVHYDEDLMGGEKGWPKQHP